MQKPINILHLEDDPLDTELIQRTLDSADIPCKITRVETSQEFSESLRLGGFGLILADFNLPDYDGISAMRFSKEHYPDIPFIFISGIMGEDSAIQALTEGATDYVLKQKLSRIIPAVRRALQDAENMTERRRSEVALRESEQRYRNIFEESFDGLFLTSPAGKFLDMNKKGIQMFGYATKEEILNLDLERDIYAHPSDRKRILDMVNAQGSAEYEIVARKKSGELMVTICSITPVKDEQGVVTTYRGIIRDITEQRRAEQALQESGMHYRQIVDLSQDMIVIHQQGKIVFINEAGVKLSGASSPDQIIGRSILEFVPSSHKKIAQERMQTSLAEGEKSPMYEQKLRRLDGTEIDIDVRGMPIRYRGEEAIQFVARDITERKRAEAELERRQLLFRALFDRSPDTVVVIDPHDPNNSWPIIDCNETACLTSGYSRAELIGQSIDILNVAADIKTERIAYLQQLRDAGNLKVETHRRRKNGNVFPVEAIASLIAVRGRELIINVDRDITERKQAEEAVARSEQAYRTLFENVPIGLYRISAEGLILDVNPALVKMFGYKDQESLLAKPIVDFYVDPADDRKFRNKMGKSDNLSNFVAEYRRPDGTTFWTEDYIHAVRNEAGVVLFHEGSLIDITERKQAEDALKKERAHLKKRTAELDTALRETEGLFSAAQGILTSTHLTQIYQRLMEHFVELVKADRVTLYLVDHEHQEILLNLAAGSYEGVVPMTYQELKAGIAGRVFKSGQPVLSVSADDGIEPPETHERRIRDNVGSLIVVPLLTRKGAGILSVVGTVTVINRVGQHTFTKHDKDLLMMIATQAATAVENIRLYEETRQRVAELELLYESGLAISQLLNPKDIGQKLIDLLKQKMNWHHTAIRLYHPDDETLELLAFHQPNIKSGAERLALEAHFKNKISRSDQGLSGWVVQHGETLRIDNVTNDDRYVETFAGLHSGLYVPIKTGERIVGVISIEIEKENAFSKSDEQLATILATQAASIFENARLYEDAQKARDAADAANRSKSDFLANMSHEIRTPMNAVIGLTQLVLDTELNVTQRSYLQKIQTSARALLGILNDILDYSKIEAGRLDLEEVDFDLDETLRNTAGLFSIGAEEKEIELAFEIAPEVPLALNGDPLRLGQVLNNLVGNAVKFTERGEIQVKVEVDKIKDGKTWLQFSVRDTGIGITKDQLERLFHAFSQADTSTTRKFGGTGLGLTISQRLVDKMGGQIGVESVQGQGSIFHFTVPLRLALSHAPLRQISDLRGMKTLVVDDQEISLQVMDNLLNSWSFDVTLSTSGAKGLEAITEAAQSGHPFELLLIDWKMPGMDGLELAHRIRDMGTQIGRPPLVIMVTAFGREDVVKSADANKIDAVLDKPVTPSRLFDLLINLQEGRAPKSQTTSQTDNLKLFETTRPIHGAHILIVEDNATNQLVARGFLEKMALVVDIANDGLEAIDKVASQDYDVILMDLQMPKMDGLEATRRIRSMERGRNLPIIAMTASVMQKDKEASSAAGMNGHIAKPIDMDELVSVLTKWVQHRPAKAESSVPPEDSPTRSNNLILEITSDFDLNVALNWLGGDRTLLKQILASFQADLTEMGKEIQAASEHGDWAMVRSIVHKIKGTAGNVGAVALQRQTIQLESELAERSDADISALEEKIRQALELSRRFLIELTDGRADEYSASRDEVDKALDELGTFLAHNRLTPMKLLEKVQAAQTWGASGESLEKLKHETDTFNYKEALHTLESIRKELASKP